MTPVIVTKRRILLIEDSADLREILAEVMEELGHEVMVADTGEEGLERILELRPDVTLVDVGLPGIDGFEVGRRVRAHPGGDMLYLVALTGQSGGAVTEQAMAAGFDVQVTKPISLKDLPQLLRGTRRNT